MYPQLMMAQVDEELETKMFLDSGATHYCFHDRSDFQTYTDLSAKQGDSATEGGKFFTKGQGRVTQQVIVEGEEINLQFNNVLHTPKLTSNLISVACLCDVGYQVLFSAEEAIVFNVMGAFLCKQGVDRMYVLGSTQVITNAPEVKAFVSMTKPTDIQMWHRRLVHADIDMIKLMRDLVEGLDIMLMKGGGEMHRLYPGENDCSSTHRTYCKQG